MVRLLAVVQLAGTCKDNTDGALCGGGAWLDVHAMAEAVNVSPSVPYDVDCVNHRRTVRVLNDAPDCACRFRFETEARKRDSDPRLAQRQTNSSTSEQSGGCKCICKFEPFVTLAPSQQEPDILPSERRIPPRFSAQGAAYRDVRLSPLR
jgi:hypothetical protein